MLEIGSEFWAKGYSINLIKDNNVEYLLSGRTALRFIIDDICKTHKVQKTIMPSYCCESMIRPFIDLGIKVQFYQVDLDCVDYSYNNDADVVLLVDFFGYVNRKNIEIASREKSNGKIIIYDSTHKIDGNVYVEKYADYSFCSYRKWLYCNFAKAVKYNGEFKNDIKLKPNDYYVNIRDNAAHAKEEYILGLTNQKEAFLSDFSIAEQVLESDYVGYLGEPIAFDINDIVSKRRENATYLMDNLKDVSKLKLWKENLQDEDVPMFVPIFVDPLIRNDLRNVLIKENIYCPIHWPKSNHHKNCNDIYDRELSLVCDQRYGIADMERMVRVIKGYFGK